MLQKANEKLLFLKSSGTVCGITAYLSQFQNLLYFKLSLTLLLLLLTKKQQQQKHLWENFRTRFKNHMISTV